MSFLALHTNKEKFDTRLLVIGYAKDVSYDYDPQTTTFLNKKRVLQGITSIVKFLKTEKPDIAISAIAHLNAAMALISFIFPKIKFIGRETSIASLIKPSTKNTFSIWSLLSKITPRRLSKIICQSKDMKVDLKNNLGYPEAKMVIINNPINKKFKVKTRINQTPKQLITIGRLVPVKGHKRILSALTKVNTPFHYTIIGDGPLKEDIFNVLERDGLLSQVTHIPFSNKIEDYLSKSDLFLQGSYSEGFPNALLESCAVGTPVLAFNAPGGTPEIIEEGINGYMVDSEAAFIHKLNEILIADWTPQQVSQSVHEKYNERKILTAYENLFLSVIELNYSK